MSGQENLGTRRKQMMDLVTTGGYGRFWIGRML